MPKDGYFDLQDLRFEPASYSHALDHAAANLTSGHEAGSEQSETDVIIIMIIQLTPHRGFSVTDYIKYYAYLYYLLSLDYLFLQQL